MRPTLSIVVPVFNERENLADLHREICNALRPLEQRFELILVDDGSNDGSFGEAGRLVTEDDRVRVIRLGRNFGQSAAIQAGCDVAQGIVVVTLDGDLQNDPSDIPRLLAELERGFDVVCGWRKRREARALTRRLPSMIANKIIGKIAGLRIHDHGCTLRAFRREVILRQPLYSDMHRFALVLMSLSGVRYSEVVINDRPRASGHSKYGLDRIWKVFLDLMTVFMIQRFASRPGRWFALIGLPFLALSIFFVAGMLHQYWVVQTPQTFPVVYLGGAVLSVFGTLHFLLLALVAELVIWLVQPGPPDSQVAIPATELRNRDVSS